MTDFEGMPTSDNEEFEHIVEVNSEVVEPPTEHELCMRAISEVMQASFSSDSEEDTDEKLTRVLDAKILDFGAGRGLLG